MILHYRADLYGQVLALYDSRWPNEWRHTLIGSYDAAYG